MSDPTVPHNETCPKCGAKPRKEFWKFRFRLYECGLSVYEMPDGEEVLDYNPLSVAGYDNGVGSPGIGQAEHCEARQLAQRTVERDEAREWIRLARTYLSSCHAGNCRKGWKRGEDDFSEDCPACLKIHHPVVKGIIKEIEDAGNQKDAEAPA